MAEERIENRTTTTEPAVQRSLTGSVAGDVLMMTANGAAFTAGKIGVEQIAQHISNRPKDPPPPSIELPSGYKEE